MHQGDVVKHFKTKINGALHFSQSSLSRAINKRSELEAQSQSPVFQANWPMFWCRTCTHSLGLSYARSQTKQRDSLLRKCWSQVRLRLRNDLFGKFNGLDCLKHSLSNLGMDWDCLRPSAIDLFQFSNEARIILTAFKIFEGPWFQLLVTRFDLLLLEAAVLNFKKPSFLYSILFSSFS